MNLYRKLPQYCFFFFFFYIFTGDGLVQYLCSQECCYKTKTLVTKTEDISAWGVKNPQKLNSQNFNQPSNTGTRKERLAGFGEAGKS